MERIINTVPAPIRRFISRGLSFPTLSRLSSSGSLNGADQSPLPSAGKRQREASDDEEDGNAPKRVKMDVDTSATVGGAASAASESPGAAVDQIRPGVEAMSIGATEASPSANGSAAKTAGVEASPGTPSKKGKYQRNLRGTRKSAASDATSVPTPSKPRLGPKRQCALLIGFCGEGYSGMQM
jgi:tRNA pseudouridine38-40 synthase